MKQISRRAALQMGLSMAATTQLPDPLFAATPSVDWSHDVIAANMHRQPEPQKLGGWGYAISLYLYGMYLFYQRSKDKKYLTYIQRWVDSHISADGTIDRRIDALDYILPGNLLLILFKETGQSKYKTAAKSIRNRLDSYPRTEDGGFWHALSRNQQLWLDGVFMLNPFLARYGAAFNDQRYAFDEATKQILIYARHLNDPSTGLMFHAYDESGTQPWADPETHHSAFFWCRAIGWFGMAMIEILELLPHNHENRARLIALVNQLAGAYAKYQDPATGLWYQVVDKATTPGNWLETSSSCMYTYTISRAIERGYINKRFAATSKRGYRAVIARLTRDEDGFAHIPDICEGTNVGDLSYYFARPRSTDDFHGLGAFLIMNEQLRKKGF